MDSACEDRRSQTIRDPLLKEREEEMRRVRLLLARAAVEKWSAANCGGRLWLTNPGVLCLPQREGTSIQVGLALCPYGSYFPLLGYEDVRFGTKAFEGAFLCHSILNFICVSFLGIS